MPDPIPAAGTQSLSDPAAIAGLNESSKMAGPNKFELNHIPDDIGDDLVLDDSTGKQTADIDGDDGATPEPAKAAKPKAEKKSAAPADDDQSLPDFSKLGKDKADDTPAPDPAQQGQKRDYSKIPESLQPFAKKLRNEQFAAFLPLAEQLAVKDAKLAELEKAAAEKTDPVFSHPEAYRLDPQYQQLADVTNRANRVASHYGKQLENALNGRKVLIGRYDDKGQWQSEQRGPANGKAWSPMEIEQLRTLASETRAQAGQYNAQQSQYMASIQQRQGNVLKAVGELDGQLFKGDAWKPENFTAAEKTRYEGSLKLLPAELRSHPLAAILAKSTVGYTRLYEAYAALHKEVEKLRPTPKRTPAAVATEASAVGDEDEMISLTEE